jgi:hypothetical protein
MVEFFRDRMSQSRGRGRQLFIGLGAAGDLIRNAIPARIDDLGDDRPVSTEVSESSSGDAGGHAR